MQPTREPTWSRRSWHTLAHFGAFVTLLCAGILGSWSVADAQSFRCAAGTQDPEVRTVVADLGRLALEVGSTEQAETVVLAAIAEWNENAVGVPLRYMGNSGNLCPPGNNESAWCCQHNLITATDCGTSGTYGLNSARCSGTRSYTRLCTDHTSDPGNYAITLTDEYDAVAGLAHELAHSIGIDHPSASYISPQNPSIDATVATGLSNGDQRRRSLYWYDQRCVEESMPTGRMLDGVGHVQYPSGLGGEVYYGEFVSFDHRNLIDYPGDTTGRMSHLVREQGNFLYRRGASSEPIRTLAANFAGPAPTLFFAQGASQPWRVYYGRVVSGLHDFLGPDERHHAHVIYSPNEFASSAEFPLYECDSMSSFENCSFFAWDPIFVSEPITAAYDDFSGRNVFVWAEQARDPFADGDLRLSIGETSAPILVPSSPVLGRTHAKPAVACKKFHATGMDGTAYDCIIAFSDAGAADGRILVRRFYSQAGPTHYSPVFDSGTTVVNGTDAEAVGGVEAWWFDGHWYLAFSNTVPLGSELRTQVWRSADSLAWAVAPGGKNLAWSAQVPAAAVELGSGNSAFVGLVAP